MSHIFGTADSSTVTSSTGLQHQPSSPSVARDIFSRGETGTVGYGINNVSGGGYDNSKPAISQQQLDFYNHSLAVAFGGGSFSTAAMVAPTHQSSPARPNSALIHSTMTTGVSKSVNGGGGELASAVSSTLASGEVKPTSAIAIVSPAILSCETTPAVTVSPSTTWSGTSFGAAVPHAIPGNYFTPASSGGGIEFCQDGAIGGQRPQLQQEQQLEDKGQQQWLAGPGSSLNPTNASAMSTYSHSSVPFSPSGQHMLQPAMFQAPHPHLPGVSNYNASTGAANSTVPYQFGLAPASRQFSQPNGGGNMGDLGASAMVTHQAPPAFAAGTIFPGGIVLPTPAPLHQPSSPYGVVPPAAMFTPASFRGFGFGDTEAGGRGSAGCFAHSYGANGIGTAGAAFPVAGADDSKQAGSQALLAAQQQQLQLRTTAPMFTVSAPPQHNVFTASNNHAAAAAEAMAAQAGLPVVPFPVNAFLQLNPLYPGLRRLVESPPVYVVDDFFSHPECDALMALANNYMIISPVVGAGAGEISESRTSSSCFLAREDLPTVCRKVMALTRKPLEHLELPQVGRYYTTQKYANHWDAFDLGTEDGRRFAQNGGQRVCTVLVYLNDVLSGGCTSFPRLGLRVQPRKGMAVVFFPATLDGTLDPMLLHAAEPAIDTKWVSQIWIRQGAYHGTPTARIPRI